MNEAEKFYNDNLADGTFPAEKMPELLNMDPEFFDTLALETTEGSEDTSEKTAEPEKTTEDSEVKAEQPKTDEPKTTEGSEDRPMVEAKDGKPTIPYDVLEGERSGRKLAEAKVNELAAENASIKEALGRLEGAQEEFDEGDTTQEELDSTLEEVRGEFPELVSAFEKMLEQKDIKHQAEIEELKAKVEPVVEKNEENEYTEHVDKIIDAHKDFDSIMEGTELADWHEKQPQYLQEAYQKVMESGTATEIIHMLNSFKDDTGYGASPSDRGDQDADGKAVKEATSEKDKAEAQAKADKLAEEAKDKPPNSLSEVPASTQALHDETEAMMQSSGLKLLNKFDGKTPEEIEKIISKAV